MLDGGDAVLVTVIASSGSTPRGARARMLVENGRLYGTIGGGAIEYKAGQIAEEVLKEKRSLPRDISLCQSRLRIWA